MHPDSATTLRFRIGDHLRGAGDGERWMKALLLCVTCVATMFICSCKRGVASPSMSPTITPGESVTVDYSAYFVAKPKRWDVVAFCGPTPFLRTNMPGGSVKRVVALPTETISLTSTGILVNGTPLSMPAFLSNVVYCPPDKTPQKQDLITFPYTVPQRHYFVVGDNWANSLDSRYYGAVCITDIVGRVVNK
jgi:signal peptidase I